MIKFLFPIVVALHFLVSFTQSNQVYPPDNVSVNLTFLEPHNHTFVKPSLAVKLKVLILEDNTALFEASDYELCLALHSTNFDRIDAGCTPLPKVTNLEMNFLPFGFVQIRASLVSPRHGITASSRVSVHVVPLLPEELDHSLGNRLQAPSQPQTHLGSPRRASDCLDIKGAADNTRSIVLPNTLLPRLQQFSIGIVVHRGGKSFRNSLKSWFQSDLLTRSREVLLFLQEWPLDGECFALHCARGTWEVPDSRVDWVPGEYNVRVIGSSRQLNIGPALSYLANATTSEFFMFLEEDFRVDDQLSPGQVESTLASALQLLAMQGVDLVKLRSRAAPGSPFYPLVWRGREEQMFRFRTPYVSNHSALETSHWLAEPDVTLSPAVWRCGHCGQADPCFCTFSSHSGWTNNPFLARKTMVTQLVGQVAFADWTLRLESAINLTPFLWDDQCFVVGQGKGLFTHDDVDGRKLSQQSPFENPFEDWWTFRQNQLEYT